MSRSSSPRRRILLVSVLVVSLGVIFCVAGFSLLAGGRSPSQTTPVGANAAAAVGTGAGGQATLRRRLRDRSASAKAARRASRRRYTALSAKDALALARRTFPGQMKSPLYSGTGSSRGTRVIAQHGEGKALVEGKNGKKMLLVSSQPLEAKNEQGKLALVDLSLTRTADEIAPVNSSVPFVVDPTSPAKISFTGLGIGMQLADTPNGRAQLAEDRVFFADMYTDTDAGILPLPDGSELFLIARSDLAPERFALSFDLPAGATLRRAVSEHPIDGHEPQSIEIRHDGQTVAYVHPPVAHDATGLGVPATMSISGSDIILDVSHRDRDLAYPLSIDPEVRTPTNQTWGWGGWTWRHNKAGASDAPWAGAAGNCAYYCGLYQALPQNGLITDGSEARWSYQAPPKTYVGRTEFGGISHNAWIYQGQSITGWYQGIGTATDAFNPTTWSQGNYSNQDGNTGGGGLALFYGRQAAYGWLHDVDATNPVEGNKAIFGLGSDNPFNTYSYAVGTSGGTAMSWSEIYLGDNYAPAWHTSTPDPDDVPWTDDTATPTHTRSFRATDQGLGLYQLKLTGAATINAPPAAEGTVADDTITAKCTGNPPLPICPTDWPSTDVGYRLNEGNNILTAQASDLAGGITTTPRTWTEKIDRTPPGVTLAGAAVDANYIESGSYGFRAEALDGSSTSPRSGAKRLTVVLADSSGNETQLHDSGDTACPAGSCLITRDLQLDAGVLAEGRYTLIARATDQLGHESSTQKLIVVDRAAPQLEMSGDLNDGRDSRPFSLQDDADLLIRATDSAGAVSSRIRIDGEKPASDADKSQSCNSGGCSLAHDYLQQLAPLGAGEHTISVTIEDVAGRMTTDSWQIDVDDPEAPPPDEDPDAPSELPSSRSDSDTTRYKPCESAGSQVPFPVFSLGSTFEALPATAAMRRCDDPYGEEDVRANYVSYIYGDCDIDTEVPEQDRCAPPLEIQSWPGCERGLADYVFDEVDSIFTSLLPGPLIDRRAVPTSLFEDGLRLEVYTGISTLVIFGDDPAQIIRAVSQLRQELLGPPSLPSALGISLGGAPIVGQIPVLGDLSAPAAGALDGTLSCAS